MIPRILPSPAKTTTISAFKVHPRPMLGLTLHPRLISDPAMPAKAAEIASAMRYTRRTSTPVRAARVSVLGSGTGQQFRTWCG